MNLRQKHQKPPIKVNESEPPKTPKKTLQIEVEESDECLKTLKKVQDNESMNKIQGKSKGNWRMLDLTYVRGTLSSWLYLSHRGFFQLVLTRPQIHVGGDDC